jgi:hypothetical protein
MGVDMRNRAVALAVCLAGITGCHGLGGSGIAKSETRPVPAITAIDIGGAVDLVVTVADQPPSLTIRGDDNLLPHLLTTVKGERLEIHTDIDVSPKLPLRVAVTVPSLVGIHATGAAKIQVTGLHGDAFSLYASGAGTVELAGEVSQATIDVSGAAHVQAHALKAHTTKVELSGAANVTVFADHQLTVDVSGAGMVEYAGHPLKIEKSVTGVGVVRERK